MNNVHVLAIDPQIDFCHPKGALFVSGADQDMIRLAAMVKRLGKKLSQIHVTLDSHQEFHIAHPMAWVDSVGKHPNPFTRISVLDVENGTWNPRNPAWRNRFLDYVRTLEKNGRYLLCIWPPHCVIGSWGHSISPEFSDAIREWSRDNVRLIDYVTKGSNPLTEHYSAIQADVVDPKDPGTQLNLDLIDTLKTADLIAISGEALDFCVANTIRDIANNFGEENIQKFVLLTDTCSCVNAPGLEFLGPNFVKEMTARGMQVSTSVDFLA